MALTKTIFLLASLALVSSCGKASTQNPSQVDKNEPLLRDAPAVTPTSPPAPEPEHQIVVVEPSQENDMPQPAPKPMLPPQKPTSPAPNPIAPPQNPTSPSPNPIAPPSVQDEQPQSFAGGASCVILTTQNDTWSETCIQIQKPNSSWKTGCEKDLADRESAMRSSTLFHPEKACSVQNRTGICTHAKNQWGEGITVVFYSNSVTDMKEACFQAGGQWKAIPK